MYRIVFIGGEDVSARIDISRELIKKKCHIEIIGTESAENFVDSGIRYQSFDLNREFDVFGDLKSLLQIRNILKKYSEKTIVHAFDTKLNILLPIASIGLGNIRVVRTINGMGRIFTNSNVKNEILKVIYKFTHRILKKKVDYTIFQNTDNYEYFIKNKLVNNDASRVIMSSGINLSNYSTVIDEADKDNLRTTFNIKDKRLTFVLISRIIKQKGVLNYLEAAQKCFDYGLKFNFILVGQIDSNNDAVSFEQINKYKHCVNYLGRQTNIKGLLSISDIFVLPTYYSEGVPRVLLEASAMSLALLTTNMPGCNDVLLDGINGLYINVNDSEDLYIKMKYLSENKDVLLKFKINAFNHVNNFSLDKITSECFEIYKHIIK